MVLALESAPSAPGASTRAPPLGAKLVSDVEAWVLTAIVWSAHYVILTLRTYTGVEPPPADDLIRRAGVVVGAALVTMSIHWVMSRWPLTQFRERITIILAAAAVVGAAYGVFNHLAFYVIAPHPDIWEKDANVFSTIFYTFIFAWVYAAWGGFYLTLGYARELRDKERRLAEAEALAHQAQVKMLRYQINPHFLFNTLNSISALVLDRRNEAAEDILLRLSGFLRATLDLDPTQRVTLAQEFDAQRLYLDIERIRFSDRLTLDLPSPGELGRALVPSLILQPLVENAVKYAVSPAAGPAWVRIGCSALGDVLTLIVEDSGAPSARGSAPSGMGVGLSNVRARLDRLYGPQASLTAGPTPGGGWRCEIRLPLEFQ